MPSVEEKTRQKIAELQKDIISTEEKIAECIKLEYREGAKKSMRQLESDLKYLSILANGAPVDRDEDRKVMDFLRIHYDRLRDYSLPMRGQDLKKF